MGSWVLFLRFAIADGICQGRRGAVQYFQCNGSKGCD
jgi:hypothetical protein